jgi:hypothetical protein
MTVPRLIAIALIIVGTSVAWFILGGSVVIRTGESDARLSHEVEQLWGGRHDQVAPTAWFERSRVVVESPRSDPAHPDAGGGAVPSGTVTRTVVDRVPLSLVSSRLKVSLSLDQRRRGLLWYDTYGVSFAGRYRIRNTDPSAQEVFVHFDFPSNEALYDAFVFRLNGVELSEVGDVSKGLGARISLPPGGEAGLEVSYRSRGLGDWSYSFASPGVAQVRDFDMDLAVDCDGVDFPVGSISPARKTREGDGWRLGWTFENLVTGQRIGVDLPNRLNPGPVAARIIFFAPVSLLFFITVLMVLGVLSGESLHPMHYFFLSTAFFAFHLLLAYLVDHFDIHVSFLIASATSVALVVSYLRVVSGMRFALLRAGLAQLVFLVLFSYSFFFEGYTGLTVTLGSVLTLFVLMQATARLDWAEVFAARSVPPIHEKVGA